MIGWFDRVLHRRSAPPAPPPALTPADHVALATEQEKAVGRLDRADAIVRKAMKHADDVLDPVRYRGPERRSHQR